MKSSLSKLKEGKAHEKKMTIPLINLPEAQSSNTTNTHNENGNCDKHRRDIFSCTLSIPTTINEESRSSRPTTPMRDRPSAIPEEVDPPEVTCYPIKTETEGDFLGHLDFSQARSPVREATVFIFPESPCVSPNAIPPPKILLTLPGDTRAIQAGDTPEKEETAYNQRPNTKVTFLNVGNGRCHHQGRGNPRENFHDHEPTYQTGDYVMSAGNVLTDCEINDAANGYRVGTSEQGVNDKGKYSQT